MRFHTIVIILVMSATFSTFTSTGTGIRDSIPIRNTVSEDDLHFNISAPHLNKGMTLLETESYLFLTYWGKWPPNGGIQVLHKNNLSLKGYIADNNDDHRMVQVTEDEKFLFYADYYGDRIVMFNMTSMTVEKSLENQMWPSEIYLSQNGSYLYYSECSGDEKASSYLSRLDIDNWTIDLTRNFEYDLRSLNPDEKNRTLYARDEDGNLMKLDLWTFSILEEYRMDLDREPLYAPNGELTLSPNGTEIWFCDPDSPYLRIFNSTDLSMIDMIDLGWGQNWDITFSPTSPVASIGSKSESKSEDPLKNLTFIDTRTREILGQFQPGPNPQAYYIRAGNPADRYIVFPFNYYLSNQFSFYKCSIQDVHMDDRDLTGKKAFSLQLPQDDGRYPLTYRIDQGPSWCWMNGTRLTGAIPGNEKGTFGLTLTAFNPFFESRRVDFNITVDAPASDLSRSSQHDLNQMATDIDVEYLTGNISVACKNSIKHLFGDELRDIVSHGSSTIRDIEWAPGATMILSLSEDGKIQYTDPFRSSTYFDTTIHGASCIDISPNGTFAAVGNSDGSISLLDLGTGRMVRLLEEGKSPVDLIAFNTNGMDSVDFGGDFLFWSNGSSLNSISIGDGVVQTIHRQSGIKEFHEMSAGFQVIDDEGLELTDLSGNSLCRIQIGAGACAMRDGHTAIQRTEDPHIAIIFEDGSPVDCIRAPDDISNMAFSPGAGKLIVTTVGGEMIVYSRYDDGLPMVIDDPIHGDMEISASDGPVYIVNDPEMEIECDLHMMRGSSLTFMGGGRIGIDGSLYMDDGCELIIRGRTGVSITNCSMEDSSVHIDSRPLELTSSHLRGSSFKGYPGNVNGLVELGKGSHQITGSYLKNDGHTPFLMKISNGTGKVSVRNSEFVSNGSHNQISLDRDGAVVANNILMERGGCSLRVTGSENRIFRNTFFSHVSEEDPLTGEFGDSNVYHDREYVGNLWMDDTHLGRVFPRYDEDGDGISESNLPYGRMVHMGFEGDMFPIIQGYDPATVTNSDPPRIEAGENRSVDSGDEVLLSVFLVNWYDLPSPAMVWESGGEVIARGNSSRYVFNEPGKHLVNVSADIGYSTVFTDSFTVHVPWENESAVNMIGMDACVFPEGPLRVEQSSNFSIIVIMENTGTLPVSVEYGIQLIDRPDLSSPDAFRSMGGNIGCDMDSNGGVVNIPRSQNRTMNVTFKAPETENDINFGITIILDASPYSSHALENNRESMEIPFYFTVMGGVKDRDDPTDDRKPVENESEDGIEPDTPEGDEPDEDEEEGIPLLPLVIPIPFAVILIGLLSVASLTDEGRWKLLGLVPLKFASLKERDADDSTRMSIINLVFSSPGSSITEISESLNIFYSTTQYHLKKLVKEGTLKTQRDGRLRRFYPTHGRPEGVIFEVNSLQWKILDAIRRNPGISQSDISKQMGESRQKINFHIRALSRHGLIMVRNGSGRSRCYIEPRPGGRVIRR